MEPTPEQTAFMAKNWRDLIRPRTLDIEERSDTYGKFSCEPLERGFGTTLGVALRRVLLSSLQGAATTHIAIEGALHEFTALPGVVEDVTDIILNLKETLFKVETDKTYTIRLDKTGDGQVTAGDIALVDGITCLNPDHKICTLAKDGKIEMELTIATGRPAASRMGAETPQAELSNSPRHTAYPRFRVSASSSSSSESEVMVAGVKRGSRFPRGTPRSSGTSAGWE